MLVTKEIKKVLNDADRISFLKRRDGLYYICVTVKSKYMHSDYNNEMHFDYQIDCHRNHADKLHQMFFPSVDTIISTAIGNIKINDTIELSVRKQEYRQNFCLYQLVLLVARPLKSGKIKQYTYLLHASQREYM